MELEKVEGEEEKQETEKNIENLRSSAALRKEEIEKREMERKSQIFNLAKRKKVSLDDERDYSKFRTDAYANDFVDNPETKNKISSLISAMVTQIDQDNNWDNAQGIPSALGISQMSNDFEQTTQAESLDDLFDHYAHEISCDLKLKDRGPDPVKE